MVKQLSPNDYFPSVPTKTYLLNHCFNGFLPLPPFYRTFHLEGGSQIFVHWAVQTDNISWDLNFDAQLSSGKKKCNCHTSVDNTKNENKFFSVSKSRCDTYLFCCVEKYNFLHFSKTQNEDISLLIYLLPSVKW